MPRVTGTSGKRAVRCSRGSTRAPALRWLSVLLLRLQRAGTRRPHLVLVLAAIVTLGAVAGIRESRVLLAVRDMADAGMPSRHWSAADEEIFGVGHTVLFVFHPRSDSGRFSAAEIGAIRSWVAREREALRETARLLSPFDDLRPGPDGKLQPAVGADDPEALAAVLDTPWGGILTDSDARDLAVQLTFRGAGGSRWYGSFDPEPIIALEHRCRSGLLAGNPGIGLHLTGTAAFDRYALDGVRRFQLMNGVALLLLVAAMRLIAGTWLAGLLLAGVLGWAAFVVYGAMGLAGAPIDLLSVGLFLLLAVAIVEDFLFLSHEQRLRPGPWRRPFRQLLLPGFLTSLTTVVGFASLCVADVATIRRLGLFGGIGAALEWAATFLVLPAVLAVAPRLRRWTAGARGAWTHWPERLAARRLPRPAAWALVAAVAVAGLVSPRLNYNDTPVAMFASGHPYREGLEYLRRSRGWIGGFPVVLPAQASPGEIERVAAALRADPAVARVVDPWSVLEYWSGGDLLRLMHLTADAASAGLPAGDLVGADGRLRLLVLVREADVATLGRLRDRVVALSPGGDAFPAGELMTYADFAERVPRALFESLATCLAVVALLIAVLCRSLGLGWGGKPLLASLWGPAATLAVVAVARVPINFLTSVFASVLIGLAGDNAVQFACAAARGRLDEGIARRGGAALLIAVTTAAAALVFLGSVFEPPRRLGLLLAVGIAMAACGDLWILGAISRPPAARAAGRM